MPGWGDDINLMRYMRIVTSFILEQRAKDFDMLAGSRHLDVTAMCGQLQNGITACLYFLPPHRVKKIDLILMAAISQLVSGGPDARCCRSMLCFPAAQAPVTTTHQLWRHHSHLCHHAHTHTDACHACSPYRNNPVSGPGPPPPILTR
jgi:hypothetical protein